MRESWPLTNSRRCRIQAMRSCLAGLICAFVSITALGQAPPASRQDNQGLADILAYIHSGWDSLTRSTSSCAAVADPKLTAPPVIYLPAGFDEPSDLSRMEHECKVTVAHPPQAIHRLGTIDVESINPPGLLYLRNKYVVPGGRFNEMYGWDSYFIILGLLRDGRVDLARGMVDNFFFEIEHYGALLNANRTYYLTRSQPPFLSSMVLAVYEASRRQPGAKDDKAWLERAYQDLSKDYEMWTHDPHLAGDTGLSRYYDFGDGPPPEAVKDETGFYRKVAQYFFFHPEQADHYLVESQPDIEQLAAGAA